MKRPLYALLLLCTHFPAAAYADVCAPAEVVLVVDRSSSMSEPLRDGMGERMSKWEAAVDAARALAEASGGARVGAVVFPVPDACGPGELVLAPGAHDARELSAALGSPPPSVGNYTPIAQTLARVGAMPIQNDAHIVLITDGWQWCAPYDASMRGASVAAIRELRASGKTVHIVGFGGGVDARSLNESAIEGGAARAGCDASLTDARAEGHCYHQAHDRIALVDALEHIALRVRGEACDGMDNDCDGVVDEGHDWDGDGISACAGDCNDRDVRIFPGATELCDGVDRDCDGVVMGCECEEGTERSCTVYVGTCHGGHQICLGGEWSACMGIPAPSPELCNGSDEDCDDIIDEQAPCPSGQECQAGQCQVVLPPLSPGLDGGLRGVDAGRVPPGLGACSCSAAGRGFGGEGGSGWPLACLLSGLALLRRRMRSRPSTNSRTETGRDVSGTLSAADARRLPSRSRSRR